VPNVTLADPALFADLGRQLAACRAERDEALALQAASAEILRVINRSPGDLASVFDVILEKATRIGEAKFGIVYRFDGDLFRIEAVRDATPAFIEYLRQEPPRLDPKNALGRLLQAKQPIHIADIKAEPAYAEREPARVAWKLPERAHFSRCLCSRMTSDVGELPNTVPTNSSPSRSISIG